MTAKRTKEIKIRLTEDEHAALLARCPSPKLAEWMRETCLDVRKPKARKIPLIDPQLLRALAGIGNNVNQIARLLHNDPVFTRTKLYELLIQIERDMKSIREEYTGDDR
ncbi:TPA: MobC family plasmid mobilization relaxosome protein [Klebsiella pneumoniae]|nr:MobC family plasmid mobilization relaxosome protein [Klebsiella pneumoniae]HBZ0630902.1 MobC family plasmid mobilization relaxosome protein [Klebsiella pneumoniae]HDQ2700208.1 plasmid mobilization relaxosome protein MobC [Klebsiella pneumoniae]